MKEIRYIMLTMGVILLIAAFVAFTLFMLGNRENPNIVYCCPFTLIASIAGLILVAFAPDTH